MKNNILFALSIFLTVIGSFMLGVCLFRSAYSDLDKECTHKTEIIQQYQEYVNNCELLLDSVSGRDSTFMNDMSYTDVYYNYMRSKEKIDSILLSE
jgi:hypothetical protein